MLLWVQTCWYHYVYDCLFSRYYRVGMIENLKENILEFGEVFTQKNQVIKMLNLVSDETSRIDSRFLEPACGDGNFLIEVLNRKLSIVKEKYFKSQHEFEKYTFIAVASVYGVDIRNENVLMCRKRLLEIVEKIYLKCYEGKHNPQFLKVINFVLSKNILFGDALTLKIPNSNNPIVFSEWSFVSGNNVIRIEYSLANLLASETLLALPLFSDYGEQQFFPEPINKYPSVNFMMMVDEFN